MIHLLRIGPSFDANFLFIHVQIAHVVWAILAASQVTTASKRPQRSNLTSDLKQCSGPHRSPVQRRGGVGRGQPPGRAGVRRRCAVPGGMECGGVVRAEGVVGRVGPRRRVRWVRAAGVSRKTEEAALECGEAAARGGGVAPAQLARRAADEDVVGRRVDHPVVALPGVVVVPRHLKRLFVLLH